MAFNRGLIDGIGVQGHYFELKDASVNTISNNLNKLAATGLPIYISEWGYIQYKMWKPNGYLIQSDGTERPPLTHLPPLC